MPVEPGPLVQRRRLGVMLRRYREAAGLTAKEVAERLLSSPAKISRMETAQRNATLRDIRDLCEIYGITDEAARGRLMTLAQAGRARGWWQGAGLEPSLERLIGLEGSAAQIDEFEQVVIPGLVQTRDYADAVLAVFSPNDSEWRDRAAVMRMRRQEILEAGLLQRLRLVLDESALRRLVGGPEVMRAQLDRLLEISHSGVLSLQVIPFSAGAHPGMISGFTILHLDDEDTAEGNSSMATVVYEEVRGGGFLVEDPSAVPPYLAAFDGVAAAALDPARSVELIMKIRAMLPR